MCFLIMRCFFKKKKEPLVNSKVPQQEKKKHQYFGYFGPMTWTLSHHLYASILHLSRTVVLIQPFFILSLKSEFSYLPALRSMLEALPTILFSSGAVPNLSRNLKLLESEQTFSGR